MAQTASDTQRSATQAERFSSVYSMRTYSLLNLGTFARMLQAEIDAGSMSLAIVRAKQDASARLEAKGAKMEGELDYRALAIRSLVGVQLCAGLARTV